jgi:uncharacterized protein (TIGR00299 family) protein
MRVAYIQSIGGASGDMILGALIDLGVPLPLLRDELAKLPVSGYRIEASEETRCEIRGTHLKVHLDDPTHHSPKWLLETVEASSLPQPVKDRSRTVLKALWRAESRVHGEAQESLELEELGTLDTLVDVVGTAVGLHHLGVERVYAAPLVLGAASPPRRAGGYSNPAPATLELVSAAKAPAAADNPMYENAGELTTPTGAALITTLAEFKRPAFNVEGVGVGLGTKDPAEFPNVLRVWLGDTSEPDSSGILQEGRVVLLETNLDDVTGVTLGYAQEKLFDLGALDVWYTPVQMKKNRPGTVLSALVPDHLERAAFELILRETPTLGIRTRSVDRYVAERHSTTIETELGPVSVKVKSLEGRPVSAVPEPDDCRRIAKESGIPFQDVYQQVTEAARRQLLS